MSDEREIRATSDLMLDMIGQLRDLELEKRTMTPGTEEFAHLAWQVAELSRTTVRWSELQLRLANEALEAGTSADSTPLTDVPVRRLDEVLAEWRQAEIRLSQALPGSPDAEAASSDAARLRREYGELQTRKLEEHKAS